MSQSLDMQMFLLLLQKLSYQIVMDIELKILVIIPVFMSFYFLP